MNMLSVCHCLVIWREKLKFVIKIDLEKKKRNEINTKGYISRIKNLQSVIYLSLQIGKRVIGDKNVLN